MAIVTCKFCGKKFDREILPFIQIPTGKVMRYAHPDCYKEAKTNGLIKENYEIIDPKDNVMCAFCFQAMKRSSVDCKEISPGRFAHLSCFEKDKLKEKTPEEKLSEFLKTQCRWEFVPPSIMKQINKMVEQNNFTYSGIHGTLKYWYIIKGNNIDRDNPVGIVPYIYEQAKLFYKHKAEIQEKNKRQLQMKQPTINYITIKKPTLETKKDTAFSFLDEEEA